MTPNWQTLSWSRTDIIPAVKMGWASIPTKKSVSASIANTMFDFCALNRDFVFTAIITSAFKTAVKGRKMMLMIMYKIRTPWKKEEGCWRFPYILSAARQEEGTDSFVAWLEFISSFNFSLPRNLKNEEAILRLINSLLFVTREFTTRYIYHYKPHEFLLVKTYSLFSGADLDFRFDFKPFLISVFFLSVCTADFGLVFLVDFLTFVKKKTHDPCIVYLK